LSGACYFWHIPLLASGTKRVNITSPVFICDLYFHTVWSYKWLLMFRDTSRHCSHGRR